MGQMLRAEAYVKKKLAHSRQHFLRFAALSEIYEFCILLHFPTWDSNFFSTRSSKCYEMYADFFNLYRKFRKCPHIFCQFQFFSRADFNEKSLRSHQEDRVPVFSVFYFFLFLTDSWSLPPHGNCQNYVQDIKTCCNFAEMLPIS